MVFFLLDVNIDIPFVTKIHRAAVDKPLLHVDVGEVAAGAR